MLRFNLRKIARFSTDQNLRVPMIEVPTPVFPLTRHVVQLSERKFQVFFNVNVIFQELAKMTKLNVTALVRQSIQNRVSQETTPPDQNQLINQYYTVGTFCNAQLRQSTLQMIINGVQRVQLLDISSEKLPEGTQIQAVQMDAQPQIVEEEQESDDDPHEQVENQDNQEEHTAPSPQFTRNNLTDPHSDQLLFATVRFIHEPKFSIDIQIESQLKHLIDTYSKILYMNRSQLPLVNYNFSDAFRIIDSLAGFLCSVRYFETAVMQETLETLDLPPRLEKVHGLMTKYLVFLQYYSDVGVCINFNYYKQLAQQNIKARKAQEFYNEMFKIVKGAVEGKKGKEALIESLSKRLALTKPPDHVKKLFAEESQRYLQMDDMSTESNMIRTYLDWITSLPYGVVCKENTDLGVAKKALDEDHYGMEDIKERILEFIAVSSLSEKTKGRILLLVGPPGVGKTSLAASIAKAVGRPFARVSMGGESDSSFLKGHRRTYVGSYPGKIIHSLKLAQKQNCVILLDEIDKLGRSEMHGDPQSNLLEVLDPEQNKAFTDNYLDFPIDLSQVLFICSANTTQTIQSPLLDRMDVIELSSYTNHEKKQIYNRHLLQKAIKESGLDPSRHSYSVEQNVIDTLIKDYCREPGVRSLEKSTRKIVEKIAYQIINRIEESSNQNTEIIITTKDLPSILGQPKFSDFKFKKLPPGVVIGLAYTEYGGSLLFLEVTQSRFLPATHINQSKPIIPGLKVTGSLGDVMQESMQIAYTYAKSYSFYNLQNKQTNEKYPSFLETNEVHIHAPEGAIPKDGPSAGVAITSALLSLALNVPIPNDIGMTGEISLNGLVLPIGGCKEKILAAQREGLKRLIFPEKNKSQVQKLQPEVKEGLQILFVREYGDVFRILFPNFILQTQSEKAIELNA